MNEILHVAKLTRRFGGLVAVNELSFSVGQGELVGLLGPNGSGKTTALNVISGLLSASAGTVTYRGDVLNHLRPHQIALRKVARTFQLVRPLPSLTLSENVELALAFKQPSIWGSAARERARDLLAQVGLVGDPNRHASSLTYIDLKRLELARALGSEPQLLLLDEWLAGLNPIELNVGIDLLLSLQNSGITILMVEHVMAAIRALCGRCIVMSAGRKIADGLTGQVLSDPEVVHAYLGVGRA